MRKAWGGAKRDEVKCETEVLLDRGTSVDPRRNRKRRLKGKKVKTFKLKETLPRRGVQSDLPSMRKPARRRGKRGETEQ